MVAVVKWLTRRIVAPLRVGSTPTSHPTLEDASHSEVNHFSLVGA